MAGEKHKAKLLEEIGKIDTAAVDKCISDVIGAPVTVKVDWDLMISDPELPDPEKKWKDCVDIIHCMGEAITKDYICSKTIGFGKLCESENRREFLQTKVNTIQIRSGWRPKQYAVDYVENDKAILVRVNVAALKNRLEKSVESGPYWGGIDYKTGAHQIPYKKLTPEEEKALQAEKEQQKQHEQSQATSYSRRNDEEDASDRFKREADANYERIRDNNNKENEAAERRRREEKRKDEEEDIRGEEKELSKLEADLAQEE